MRFNPVWVHNLHFHPYQGPKRKKTSYLHYFHHHLHTLSIQRVVNVGKITPWEAFNWEVNITHKDTILPKSLSLWIWAQLCYINSLTFLLLLHVGFPLTRVYPTISPSHVSHRLSLGFETSFLGSRINPTSSPLPMSFVFFFLLLIIHGPLVRHPWTHVIPTLLFMGTRYVYIIHGNLALHHCSNPLATLFVRSFSKIVAWAPSTRTPSLLQLRKELS